MYYVYIQTNFCPDSFCLVFVNPVSTATVGFSDGTPITPERKEYRYGNDRLLIGAYVFRSWGINDDNVRYMSESGLDFIISTANKEYLDLCKKYSVGVIAQGYSVPHSSRIISDEKITVYRKGVATKINSDSLDITLDNEEGIFVTVSK